MPRTRLQVTCAAVQRQKSGHDDCGYVAVTVAAALMSGATVSRERPFDQSKLRAHFTECMKKQNVSALASAVRGGCLQRVRQSVSSRSASPTASPTPAAGPACAAAPASAPSSVGEPPLTRTQPAARVSVCESYIHHPSSPIIILIMYAGAGWGHWWWCCGASHVPQDRHAARGVGRSRRVASRRVASRRT
jgi:hypothetical protein